MCCEDLQVASDVLLHCDSRAVHSSTELSEVKNARECLPPKSLNFDGSLGPDGHDKLE